MAGYDFPFPEISNKADLKIYAAAPEDNGLTPMLLVHGFLSSRAQWFENLDAMQQFCRPIVVEHFGHGRSAAPASPDDCTLPALIEQFEQLREFLGLERWTLCGHSLGGAICLNYLLTHPARISAVIFSNARSAFGHTFGADAAKGVNAFTKQIEEGGLKVLENSPFHPAKMKHVKDSVRQALIEDAKIIDPIGLARAMRVTNVGVSVRGRVQEFASPLFLINGKLERAFQDDRAWAEQTVPNLQVVDIEDGGHNVNAEHPDKYNKAVSAFLSSVIA